MIIDRDFTPNPSDFGVFVYCAAKWALRFRNPLPPLLENDSRVEGRKNEYKCIDWVCKEYRISDKQIVFNGTGENNSNYLTSSIGSVDMCCKPDLIITKYGRNILFEFKAVKELEYLNLREFDSDHAQIWCYTKLKELQIDEYHLFRYHIEPKVLTSFSPWRYKTYTDKRLLFNDLDSSKFGTLFEKYIKVINVFKMDDTTIENLFLKDKETFSIISSLPTEPNKKCHNCIRRIKHHCELYTE